MWTLNAHGHSGSEDDERKLVAELTTVLTKFRAISSGFVSEYHRGPVHGLPAATPKAAKTASEDAQE